MATTRIARAALAASLVGLAACGAPEVSDTGYVGTWTRGSEERSKSTLSIVRDGERYLVRWNLTSADGKWKVNCSWDGPCEEFRDGEKVAAYTFSTSVNPQTKRLVVECNGKNLSGTGSDLHWIDELILKRKGLRLVAEARVQGDQTYGGRRGPRRIFSKVSDEVSDPPRLAQAGGG